MIDRGSILSEHLVLGTNHEEIGPFTNSFITNRALTSDNMVAIFQGSNALTYFNPAKNHRDGRLVFRLIYNHYLDFSNIDHMAAGSEKNLAKCSYIGKKRNWTLEKYATLHKEHHSILVPQGHNNIFQLSS